MSKDEIHPMIALAVVFVIAITIPFSLILIYYWVFLSSILFTWQRVLHAFSSEIRDQTLSSLYVLPFSTKELLKKKIESARGMMYPYKSVST